MPWKESVMQQRYDVIQQVLRGRPVAALAREYDVSRQVIYKWLRRYQEQGPEGLEDRSRRPHTCPSATDGPLVEEVVALREKYPHWGAKKLHAILQNQGPQAPCRRTVHRILRRRDLLVKPPPEEPPALQRFERGQPNELWQLDFKSPVYLYTKPTHTKVIPLSVLDDHSRFAVGLQALPNQQLLSLWPALWEVFGCYGLPEAILTDNANGLFASHRGGVTTFTARLWRLGVAHHHGRPYHPQTQGKVERYHGTLEVEVFKGRRYETLEELQTELQFQRRQYNYERPHEALELRPPGDYYRPSQRSRPKKLPPLEHPAGADLRKVRQSGAISVRSCQVRVGEGLAGEWVEVVDEAPELVIRYGDFKVRRLLWEDLRPGEWL